MILDLEARSECDLKIPSGIRHELAKVGILAILAGSGNFNIGVGLDFRKLE